VQYIHLVMLLNYYTVVECFLSNFVRSYCYTRLCGWSDGKLGFDNVSDAFTAV